MDNKDRFLNELNKVKRDGLDILIKYIKEQSDMFTAPSSTKFHMSVKGGLLQHSLNVYDALKSMLQYNEEDNTFSYCIVGQEIAKISEESLIIITLLHDLCKTKFYATEKRNKKIDNQWKEVDVYTVSDQIPYGHGEKSVMMIESCMKLSMEERMAIRWHMGFPETYLERNTFNAAVEKFPIIWALHTADMLASHVMEDIDDNKPLFAKQNNEAEQ